ncbi:MAG: phytase [Pseudomonadales bacterium]|nr:phytase [Pseudomonadales bacterium]
MIVNLKSKMKSVWAAVMALTLVACQSQESVTVYQGENITLSAENVALLTLGEADRVIASEKQGLMLLDKNNQVLSQYTGSFEGLDVRELKSELIIASFDRSRQQVAVFGVTNEGEKPSWGVPRYLSSLPYGVEGLCLSQQGGHIFLFVLGEAGQGGQWLLTSDDNEHGELLKVRKISFPPLADSCTVDDSSGELYVNEVNSGVWIYPAQSEAETQRRPAAMLQPFGDIPKAATSIGQLNKQLFVLDGEAKILFSYENQQGHFQLKEQYPLLQWLPQLEEPEQISVRQTNSKTEIAVLDDGTGLIHTLDIFGAKPTVMDRVGLAESAHEIKVVEPSAQTVPMEKTGDAADDPAIWVHPTDKTQSLILGTNKQQGLMVYNLDGDLVQSLKIGRLNNVDVRYGSEHDIAVASHRDTNSLSVFKISHSDGSLSHMGDIKTPLQDIYGICLYQPELDHWHAVVNDKNGTFIQYHLIVQGDSVSANELRRFAVESQPEGCVADDKNHRLFVGEEDVGVWWLDARADKTGDANSNTEKQMVLKVGEILKADVEGLALYESKHSADANYLVISSQGNDSYVVLNAAPPFDIQGVFRVGINRELQIDGASETDGLDVTAANLGGVYEQGLLVVQDGRNRMPEANQNFKLVPWASVMKAIQ